MPPASASQDRAPTKQPQAPARAAPSAACSRGDTRRSPRPSQTRAAGKPPRDSHGGEQRRWRRLGGPLPAVPAHHCPRPARRPRRSIHARLSAWATRADISEAVRGAPRRARAPVRLFPSLRPAPPQLAWGGRSLVGRADEGSESASFVARKPSEKRGCAACGPRGPPDDCHSAGWRTGPGKGPLRAPCGQSRWAGRSSVPCRLPLILHLKLTTASCPRPEARRRRWSSRHHSWMQGRGSETAAAPRSAAWHGGRAGATRGPPPGPLCNA